MISRCDLGLEIPAEKSFIAQKWMVEKCNLAAKPVFICSQILESMTKSTKPSRAEASDLAAAILDGVDVISLNEETAFNSCPFYPIQALSKICVEAEKTMDYRYVFNNIKLYSKCEYGTAEGVALTAVSSVLDLKVDCIVCVTDTGKLGRLAAKFRPEVAIFVCSPHDFIVRQLNAVRGVTAFLLPECDDML